MSIPVPGATAASWTPTPSPGLLTVLLSVALSHGVGSSFMVRSEPGSSWAGVRQRGSGVGPGAVVPGGGGPARPCPARHRGAEGGTEGRAGIRDGGGCGRGWNGREGRGWGRGALGAPSAVTAPESAGPDGRRTSGCRPCGGADPAALGTALSPTGDRVSAAPVRAFLTRGLRCGRGREGGGARQRARNGVREKCEWSGEGLAAKGWGGGGSDPAPMGTGGRGEPRSRSAPGSPQRRGGTSGGGHRGDPLPRARGERRRRSPMMEEFRLHGDPAGTARPLSVPGDGP